MITDEKSDATAPWCGAAGVFICSVSSGGSKTTRAVWKVSISKDNYDYLQLSLPEWNADLAKQGLVIEAIPWPEAVEVGRDHMRCLGDDDFRKPDDGKILAALNRYDGGGRTTFEEFLPIVDSLVAGAR